VKEPERLLRSGATEFERTLLESVQYERPSPDLTSRMERALGIALVSGFPAAIAAEASAATQTTVAQGSGAAVAAQPAASSVVASNVVASNAATNVAATQVVAGKAVAGKLIVGKLGAQAASGFALKASIGAIVGTGLAVSAVSFMPGVGSDAPEQNRAAPAPIVAPSEKVQAADVALDEVDAPALREEIGLLDRARASLARGDAAGARSVLERYRESFPRGALLREARVLWARAGAGPWRGGGANAPQLGSGTEGASPH
jgi:hypothetical protein